MRSATLQTRVLLAIIAAVAAPLCCCDVCSLLDFFRPDCGECCETVVCDRCESPATPDHHAPARQSPEHQRCGCDAGGKTLFVSSTRTLIAPAAFVAIHTPLPDLIPVSPRIVGYLRESPGPCRETSLLRLHCALVV